MGRMVVTLTLAATLVACSTAPPMKIETFDDPAALTQLRSYRTYRVVAASTQGAVDDVAMGPAIVRSVDERLVEKGYRQEPSRPDFVVKWHVSTASGQRTTTMSGPFFRDLGPMPSAGTGSVPVSVTREYLEGTLVLDVLDAGSDRLVWRGSARAELSGSREPQNPDARIEETVRRILDRFPSH